VFLDCNPVEELYNKGVGSLAYRGHWNLFDQFYISDNLNWNIPFQFYKAVVFKSKKMVTKSVPYRGYPRRSYTGTTYLGGYSDHYHSLKNPSKSFQLILFDAQRLMNKNY
jgi:hypothetical protein